MEFIVPQFIERETKILGPFDFKQTILVVFAGIICLIVYYTIKNLVIFIIVSCLVIGGILFLIFYKKEGFSIPELMKNFAAFLSQTKIYIWKRKPITPKFEKKDYLSKKIKEEKEEESPLKVVEKSNLKKLQNFLEIKTK